MKVALLLRGISYRKKYIKKNGCHKNWMINYELSRNSIYDNCISLFENCDVYISSYKSEKETDIIEYFKPKRYIFKPFGGSQHKCLINGLNLVLDEHNKKPYDLLIILRFDIKLNAPITSHNIMYDKFNFCFKENNEKLWLDTNMVGDCVHVLNGKYILYMIKTIKNCTTSASSNDPSLHRIYKMLVYFIKDENINFMIDGCYNSYTFKQKNPIYNFSKLKI